MDKVEMSEDVWSGGFCLERGCCCLCCFWFHLFCSFSFSFLFFFLFQSGNKRRIKALLSCGAVGWVFWRFIQTVVSIQPDSFPSPSSSSSSSSPSLLFLSPHLLCFHSFILPPLLMLKLNPIPYSLSNQFLIFSFNSIGYF